MEIKCHASEKEVASVVLRRDCPLSTPSEFHSQSALQRDQDVHSYRSPHALKFSLNYLKMLIYRNLMQWQSCHLRKSVSQVRRLLI